MRAVQGQHAVSVLERVGRGAARAAPSRAALIARRCLAHLLLCLPPSFHRYILCTQHPAAAAEGALTLPPLPRPIGRPEPRAAGAADAWAKQPPSAGVLALSAAAALAGGPAPAPGGTGDSEPDEAVELGLAGAYGPLPHVTRLDVSLLDGGGGPWGAALVGCSALVSLSLGVVSVGALMEAGFADLAGGLPSLTALAVRASRAQAMECAAAAAFVQSVSSVTTLLRLELVHCFAVSKEPDVGAPYVEAIGGLSALGALSSLDLADNRFGERSAEAWADAVAAMDGLRALRFAGLWHTGSRTSLRWRWSRRGARHLAALQCLELSEQRFMVDLVADVCCGGALCALSALRLCRGGITASMFADLEGVLARLPRLRVLDLEGNDLEDAGLEGVAAVLPALGALEELRFGGNRGTRRGVVAVVRAAVEVRGRGGEGVRRLGVGPAQVGAGGAEELGRLLAQLALEAVAVPGLALGGEGTRGVLRALSAVASLREVVVCDGFCAGPEAGGAADEGTVFGGLEGVGVVGIQFLRKGACVGKDEVMVRVREALPAAGARVVQYDGRSGSLCQ